MYCEIICLVLFECYKKAILKEVKKQRLQDLQTMQMKFHRKKDQLFQLVWRIKSGG